MTKYLIHRPNTGEEVEENNISKIVLASVDDPRDCHLLFAGTKIRFAVEQFSNETVTSLLKKLQKYNPSLVVLNNKPYVEMNRPRARPLWQKGLIKIAITISLGLGLFYIHQNFLEDVHFLYYAEPQE